MRKKSSVDDFSLINIPGTYYMTEKTNFLVGKMMDIEDEIRITYNYTFEELTTMLSSTQSISNLAINTMFANSINNLSYDDIKNKYVKLIEEPSQSKQESEANTKWIFNLDANKLLLDYLYSEIYTNNPQSPFKKININDTPNKNISEQCINYIKANILDKYRLKEFILWTKYIPLKTNVIVGLTNFIEPIPILYKKPTFSIQALPKIITDTKKETVSIKPYADNTYDIIYKQTQSSQFNTFLYYFDIIFEKI